MLSLCRNEWEAEEVTQEAFFRAMKASDFRGDSSIYSWLCRIAKNIWLNRCKKHNREISTEDFTQTQDDSSFEEQLMNKDIVLQVHEILHTLEEPYKEVFSLRVFGELAFKDIARLFGKTESWGRVTFHRAKKMITEQMRKKGVL
ncbi:MAG: RNA polymerase sigma factor [Eubacterium sp.]|nr:RNA polymerase sigma factor [Eubacterium sp.]